MNPYEKPEQQEKTFFTTQGVEITLSSHFNAHSDLIPFVPQIIEKIDFSNKSDEIVQKVTIEGTKGKQTVVPTDSKDKVAYFKRKGRYLYSRFVANKDPVETNSVVAILGKDREQADGKKYTFMTAYFGDEIVPPEPGDKKRFDMKGDGAKEAEQQAFDFWEHHAFCLDYEESNGHIDTQTKKEECPWQKKYQ